MNPLILIIPFLSIITLFSCKKQEYNSGYNLSINNDTIVIYKDYHKNGRLKSIVPYEHKVSVDTIILFDEDTYEETVELIYNSGINRNGIAKFWDEKGNLIDSGRYEYGFRNGEWKSFYENGAVKTIESYSNHQANGKHLEFFQNSDTMVVGGFKEGYKYGIWSVFFENRKLKQTGLYDFVYTKRDTFKFNDYTRISHPKRLGTEKQGLWLIGDSISNNIDSVYFKDGDLLKNR